MNSCELRAFLPRKGARAPLRNIVVHEQGFVEEVVEHVEHAVEGEVNDEEP